MQNNPSFSPRNLENAGKGHVWEQKFHIPFSSMISLLFKGNKISDTDNCTEFKKQCHINHGVEWNVEFSIPIKTPCRNFSNRWILKISHTKFSHLS